MAGGTGVDVGAEDVAFTSVLVGVEVIFVAVTCKELVACGVVEPTTPLVGGGKVDVGISGFKVIVGTGKERLACKADTLSSGSPSPCRSSMIC